MKRSIKRILSLAVLVALVSSTAFAAVDPAAPVAPAAATPAVASAIDTPLTLTTPSVPLEITTPSVVPALTDITGHWAEAAITEFLASGYVSGYPNLTFQPDKNVTRAEFMRMVNTTYGFTALGTVDFSDVHQGDWFYNEVAKARAAGYISGYEDGTMRPDGFITREETAAVFLQLKKLTGDEASINDFTDMGDIAAWARGSVGAAVTAGIMRGYPEKTFMPKKHLTRAEAVTVLRGSLTLALADPIVPLAAPVVPLATAATGGGGGGGTGATGTPLTPAVAKTIDASSIVAIFDGGHQDVGTVVGNNAEIVFANKTGMLNKIQIGGTNTDTISLKVTSYVLGNSDGTSKAIDMTFPDMRDIEISKVFDAKNSISISSLKALFGSVNVTINGVLTGPGTAYTPKNVTLKLNMDKVVPGYADAKNNTLTYRSGSKQYVYIQDGKENVEISSVGLTSIIMVTGESRFPSKVTVGAIKDQPLLSILNPGFDAQKETIKQAIATACSKATWADVILSDLVDHNGDIGMNLQFAGETVDVIFAYLPNK